MKDTILTILYGILILIFVVLPIIAFIIKLYKMILKRNSKGGVLPEEIVKTIPEGNYERIKSKALEYNSNRIRMTEEQNNEILQALAVTDMLNVADTNSTFSNFEDSHRGFDDGFGGGGFSGSGAGSSWDSNTDSNSYGSDSSYSNSGID